MDSDLARPSSKNRAFHQRLGFAIAGIRHAANVERSFRIHIVAAITAILASLALRPPAIWWAIVAMSIAAVLTAESLNTAFEILADHLHPESHPRIKQAKDCAAAAVLVVSVSALCAAAAMVAYCLANSSLGNSIASGAVEWTCRHSLG